MFARHDFFRSYKCMFHCVGCTSVAGCKPNCCTQPRAAPWGNDVALIKVSRSVRATCFMRGNAPCGVKGVMGYALSARGIFALAQKCRMYQSRSTFPQGVALGCMLHLGLQPATIIYWAFVQLVHINALTGFNKRRGTFSGNVPRCHLLLLLDGFSIHRTASIQTRRG